MEGPDLEMHLLFLPTLYVSVSIICCHLTAREANKYSLAVYPGGKGNSMVNNQQVSPYTLFSIRADLSNDLEHMYQLSWAPAFLGRLGTYQQILTIQLSFAIISSQSPKPLPMIILHHDSQTAFFPDSYLLYITY